MIKLMLRSMTCFMVWFDIVDCATVMDLVATWTAAFDTMMVQEVKVDVESRLTCHIYRPIHATLFVLVGVRALT